VDVFEDSVGVVSPDEEGEDFGSVAVRVRIIGGEGRVEILEVDCFYDCLAQGGLSYTDDGQQFYWNLQIWVAVALWGKQTIDAGEWNRAGVITGKPREGVFEDIGIGSITL
jgi:hypothetical protein